MLAILEYGAGNQTSVARAFEYLGIACKITASPADLENCAGIVFPGVGAASQAMTALNATGLGGALARAVAQGRPLLGICLGCQILLDESEEGPTTCLGLLPGVCQRFSPAMPEAGDPVRVPHMGWNSLTVPRPDPLFAGIPENAEFYFVHSYFAKPARNLVLATSWHGREFCSAYRGRNIWAVQFHPEKSGAHGLRLLENFYNLCARVKPCSPNA